MKKLKGIVLVVILLLASIMMPFDVYADSISLSNINGVSVFLDEITFIENVQYTVSGGTLTVQRNFFTYQAEIQFDKSYLGYVDISYKYYFTGRNDTGAVTYNQTKNQKVFVNGDKAYFTFSFIANSSVDPLSYSTSYLTLNSSDLTEYGLLSDIETIIDILTENQDIINDIFSELQTVVSNTSLANEYLETISQIRQLNIPFESFAVVSYYLQQDFPIFDYREYNQILYPTFTISTNDIVYKFPSGPTMTGYDQYVFVFMLGRNPSLTALNTRFPLVDGEWLSAEVLDVFTNASGSNNSALIKATIGNFTKNGFNNITYNGSWGDLNITPIFFRSTLYSTNVSTDFALQFGLSNRLLDLINQIANGTTQSNQSASDLESGNDQMADDMNDLATIENGYNQQFNNQLQQIDFSSPLQNNAGILPAANFVITIFNGLINNNPFSVLIIVVCILLIGKKVIGK